MAQIIDHFDVRRIRLRSSAKYLNCLGKLPGSTIRKPLLVVLTSFCSLSLDNLTLQIKRLKATL
jgi:hypothetical protein